MKNPIKALITTIEPIDGGVPTMTKWMCQVLSETNIMPILAWYAPWRNNPELSVPCYKIVDRVPGFVSKKVFGLYEGIGIGCWLPELEFTHYLFNTKWKQLIQSCQLHICISGNPLSASPYLVHQIPFLAWIATPWGADRINRLREFSFTRQTFDSIANKPFISKLEKHILRSSLGNIIALSKYTAKEFEELSGRPVSDVMLMPVNTDIFHPDDKMTVKKRIGFSGRFCDPRKNIQLLLEAVRILNQMDAGFELVLVGEKDFKTLFPRIKELGIDHCVICNGHLNTKELAQLIQTFDVFVIPSHQEGLCIAALEAMACGVPVISTRCGGPEDFVIPGETGELVEQEQHHLARTILQITSDRERREKLSRGGYKWIRDNASPEISRQIIKRNLLNLALKNPSLFELQKLIR